MAWAFPKDQGNSVWSAHLVLSPRDSKRQRRLIWPIIINPGKQQRWKWAKRLQGRIMNLLLGIFWTRDVFWLPRQRSGGEKTRRRETATEEPDPTPPCKAFSGPAFLSAIWRAQGDWRPLDMLPLSGGWRSLASDTQHPASQYPSSFCFLIVFFFFGHPAVYVVPRQGIISKPQLRQCQILL